MTLDPALLAEFKTWNPKTQAQVAERVATITSHPRKVWYCERGPVCDGEPHDALDYRHARGDQWPPSLKRTWLTWLLRGGRGSGKTRTASEFVRYATRWVGTIGCIGINGPKIRATMIEGRSGLIRICENAGVAYEWAPSKREFTFANGAKAFMYTAEEPDSLRSPEHGLVWADEPSHFPLIKQVWDNMLFGLRVPGMPGGARVVATSTPLPNAWTIETDADALTIATAVSTYKNLVNLDPAFARTILDKYEGTRLGRQELYGEILPDVEGALWNTDMITEAPPELLNLSPKELRVLLEHIVVGVDPAGSSDRKRNQTGIVVVGRIGKIAYVLEDVSDHYTPHGWATKIKEMVDKWQADRICAESNYGAEMVQHTIDSVDPNARVQPVNSRRGKVIRAEPVVGKYEQKRIMHMRGLQDLEGQMCSWVPTQSDSPDRVDALVHAITGLGMSVVASIASPATHIMPRIPFGR